MSYASSSSSRGRERRGPGGQRHRSNLQASTPPFNPPDPLRRNNRYEGGRNSQHNQYMSPQHTDGSLSGHLNHLPRSRFNRQSANQNKELTPPQLLEFLEGGLESINNSDEERQAFISALASDAGLPKVKQLLETEYATSYSVLKPNFRDHGIPFLRILSDPRVTESLSLEQQVRTIYNVVYGFNGERAKMFFPALIDRIDSLDPASGMTDFEEEEWIEVLKLAVGIFVKTLKSNQSAAIQDGFPEILKAFLRQYKSLPPDMLPEIQQCIQDDLNTANIILTAGAEIPTDRHRKETKPRSAAKKASEEVIDLPGSLSFIGPRHDNDHEDIAEISILPTVSEIMAAGRREFLPTRYAYELERHHHQQGIQRLLDIQFRLLREDTSGQLRDATRFALFNWPALNAVVLSAADWHAKRKLIRDEGPTPMRVYYNVAIQSIQQESKGHLEVKVEFDQPRATRRLTPGKRLHWWRKAKDLRENKSVVALIEKSNEQTNVVFLVVSRRTTPANVEQPEQEEDDSQPKPIVDLCSDGKRAAISLRLATFSDPIQEQMLIHLACNYNIRSHRPDLLMIEFPAIIYRQYEGILRCLKILHGNPSLLPFSKWLTPRLQDSGDNVPIECPSVDGLVGPPPYLKNVTIDMSACCDRVEGQPLRIGQIYFSINDDPANAALNLVRQTSLDHGQAKAMVSALRHSIALTQGPPGCGKSYVGVKLVATLLANKALLGLGPIMCICYTNHALDQFLGEIIKTGVTRNVARIGSPSQIPEIEALSLETLKKQNPGAYRIPGYGQRIASSKRDMDAIQLEMGVVCNKLNGTVFEIISGYVQERFPDRFREIIEYVKRSTRGDDELSGAEAIETWMQDTCFSPPPHHRELDSLIRLHASLLSHQERIMLVEYWQKAAMEGLTFKLNELLKRYQAVKNTHTSLYHDSDRLLLQSVDILGITTIGLVNNADLIRKLDVKVMVCEEAGEVLESHVLTALLPSIQHVILIGDHLQLRPRVSTKTLSKEFGREEAGRYNLDESLFERLAGIQFPIKITGTNELARAGFPIGQLDTQRRMHPSISTLVRNTLYPELKDHERTTTYPTIAGMKRRLFWMTHENYEDPSDMGEPMQSKTNEWEADMVASLVTYISRQGVYKSGEIAVLTPYISQMRMLIEKLESIVDYDINERDLADLDPSDDEDEGADNSQAPNKQKNSRVRKSKIGDRVRIATVDNFQGEEATVIIVSLVRSNQQQNCGFLKTPNRINVLLSRAKHGMYIIGDAQTSMHVPMWKSVIGIFEKEQNFGPKLQLQCPRHPDKKTFVGSPEDFEKYAPEGGCAESCGLRLSCGHTCEVKCHPKLLHDNALCYKPCVRSRSCGHSCKKYCKDACSQCEEMVFKIRLPCGHIAEKMPCYLQNDLSRYTCMAPVMKTMIDCDHETHVPCFQKNDKTIKCRSQCGVMLPCGHFCLRRCFECVNLGQHLDCTVKCDKDLSLCQHRCRARCHGEEPCPSCKLPCQIKCKHSKCPNLCGEPCFPCAERCGWECEHEKERCILPCSVPCDRKPCEKRCRKRLKCRERHQCPGICGEKCPDKRFCRQCGQKKILNNRVDLITLSTYKEVDLDEDPIIFLSCGHFYTKSSLDGHLELDKYYQPNAPGGTRTLLMTGEQLKGCPDCRAILRDVDRYNRVFKSRLLDIFTMKFMQHSVSELNKLIVTIYEFEEKIEARRAEFLFEWDGKTKVPGTIKKILDKYKKPGTVLKLEAANMSTLVSKQEQPLMKVFNLYASAKARHGDSSRRGLVEAAPAAAGSGTQNGDATIEEVTEGTEAMAIDTEGTEGAAADLVGLDVAANEPLPASPLDEEPVGLGPLSPTVPTERTSSPPLLNWTQPTQTFHFDSTKIQTGIGIRARCLELKLLYLLLSDHKHIFSTPTIPVEFRTSLRSSIEQELKPLPERLAILRREANEAHLPAQEVEARIYQALFAALQLEMIKSKPPGGASQRANTIIVDGVAYPANGPEDPEAEEQRVRDAELDNLAICETIMTRHPGTTGYLKDLLEEAKDVVGGKLFLGGGLTSKEEREIYAAMATEFGGSGHWYYCVNGHPFTIGEYGMPMQLARCPACGAPIGGQNHEGVDGMQHAAAFERAYARDLNPTLNRYLVL